MTEGNYCLDSTITTPDANVISLNVDLVSFDEEISNLLREKETR